MWSSLNVYAKLTGFPRIGTRFTNSPKELSKISVNSSGLQDASSLGLGLGYMMSLKTSSFT